MQAAPLMALAEVFTLLNVGFARSNAQDIYMQIQPYGADHTT
jgi:hypothetical protein